MKLKSPFPYFGGKSRVAAEVLRRFGDVKTYVEPFCGSCAVLLARPGGPSGRENRKKERVWFSPHCLQGNEGTENV
jgi:hypothetical protein